MEERKKKYKFLLYDLDHKDIRDFHKDISNKLVGEIFHPENLIEVLNILKKDGQFIIILNTSDLNEKNLDAISRIRLVNQDNFVIILSNQINNEVTELSKRSKRLVILQRPMKEADVVALFCEKVILGGDVYQREHPRFDTKEMAYLEKVNGGEYSSGTILNISKGGAYIELDKKIQISRSDSVKLTLSLGNDKERVFMAEVAWADVPSAQKERLGVGLRFVATKK